MSTTKHKKIPGLIAGDKSFSCGRIRSKEDVIEVMTMETYPTSPKLHNKKPTRHDVRKIIKGLI